MTASQDADVNAVSDSASLQDAAASESDEAANDTISGAVTGSEIPAQSQTTELSQATTQARVRKNRKRRAKDFPSSKMSTMKMNVRKRAPSSKNPS